MARRSRTVTENTAVEEVTNDGTEPEIIEFEAPVDEVDVPSEDDGVEEVIATTEGEAKEDKPKKEAKPKRGELPDGLVTPVQFAKELSKPLDDNAENLDPSNWRYTHSKTGDHAVAPQMVYSTLKGAGKSKNPLTIRTVTDSEGQTRENILNLEEALAWWDAKNERKVTSAQAAKEKAEKKAEKATTETSSTDGVEAAGTVEEAE